MKVRVAFTLDIDYDQYIKTVGNPAHTKFDVKRQIKATALSNLLDLFDRHNINATVLDEE